MSATLAVHHLRLPLVEPYRLSFTTLSAFECFLVVLRRGDRVGMGEVTPLPGYGAETAAQVGNALRRAAGEIENGTDIASIASALAATAPMTASALVCAAETMEEGLGTAFEASVNAKIPLVGLCHGESEEACHAAAKTLIQNGFRTLKLKVGGGPVGADIARLRGAGAACSESTAAVDITIDANQLLSARDARELAAAAADLPVAYLEQPFAPDAWTETEKLVREIDIPVALDEAVWSASDIVRAADCGARWVKLKLCKHRGMAETRELIDLARGKRLEVIFGNGVQSVVGNHLEARIHADAGLTRASEGNGFTKFAEFPIRHKLRVEKGHLIDLGLDDVSEFLTQRRPSDSPAFML